VKGLYNELMLNCDASLKAEITEIAAEYEHRTRLGQKQIYHIEAFVAKFMSIYKKFFEEELDAMFWSPVLCAHQCT